MNPSAVTPVPSEEAAAPPPAQARDIIVRALLYLYVVAVVCPIRYWGLDFSIDNTWVYAVNLAAAHGWQGLVWTTGPLGYLVFPQDIGANFSHALEFQTVAWAALAAVFADLFFVSGFRLRNLALFSAFFGLSAPLYWFNYMGLDNLMLAAVLVLLTLARLRGSQARFVAALLIVGLIPLVKLTGGILAAGAVVGYLANAVYERRRRILRDAALALAIPAGVAVATSFALWPSPSALLQYFRGSLETASNYSVAMSKVGDAIEFGGATETLLWIVVLWVVAYKANRTAAVFIASLTALPLLLSFKHGFVRQDIHIINFFCFAGIVLALIALILPIEKRRLAPALLMLWAYSIVWLEYTAHHFDIPAIQEASGIAPMRLAYHALILGDARELMKQESAAGFPEGSRMEPEILAIVGSEPVTTTKIVYSSTALDGLNLRIYPVIQRYAAYTPYLDRLNADWIRDRGPRYLIADGDSIDDRQFWAETPAMWLEIYRWYDTRLLVNRDLLLERRAAPRFEKLQPEGSFDTGFSGGFAIPASDSPRLWSMNCRLTAWGAVEKLFFRVPPVLMAVDGIPSRVIPEVLVSPVMGNFLPRNLAELAALLTPQAPHQPLVRRVTFGGTGIGAYAPVCRVELWSLR